MDWESKFSSIVKETESNLAKVKQRLGSARASTHATLTSNGFDKFSMSDPNRYGSSFMNGDHSKSGLMMDPYGMSGSSALDRITLDQGYSGRGLGMEASPGMVLVLQDKLDQQNRVLEHFGQAVRRLEEERELYHKAMRQLREELNTINTRVSEKGVDIATERKMDQWRRDNMAEMQMMQNQLQLMRCRDDEASSSLQTAAFHKEAADLKRFVMEECDGVRREVDSIKTRLVKVELKLSAVETDNQDLMRKHDKLERSNSMPIHSRKRTMEFPFLNERKLSLTDLVQSHSAASRDLTNSAGSRNQEIMEISELRSSLRSLRDKIGNIEVTVQDKPPIYKKPKNDKKKKKLKSRPPPGNLLSPDTSDLDLSDTTDFADLHSEDFSLSAKKGRKPHNIAASDDDLDIDDLDLSTDDLLSSMVDTADLT